MDFLEEALDELLQGREEIETDLLENLMENDPDDVVKDGDDEDVSGKVCFEKVDASNLKWRKREMEAVDAVWKGIAVTADECLVKTPTEYFEIFFDDAVFELLVSESNLYAMEKNGIELKCTSFEMRRYIGVLLFMGIIKMPQTRMIWSKKLKLNFITDNMSRVRFEKIKTFFHLNNNSKQQKKGEPNYDKLYKVRPLLNLLKDRFNNLPQEEFQCVDEQTIAFKGKSSLKQYNPAKPHKWGMKMFTRAGSSGMIYDFALYVGDGTCPTYGLGISPI